MEPAAAFRLTVPSALVPPVTVEDDTLTELRLKSLVMVSGSE